MRFHRIATSLLPLLVTLALFAAPSKGADKDKWYQLLISNAPAGWMHTTERTENDLITGTTEMVFKIKRGPTQLNVSVKSESIETKEGKPVSIKSTQSMGAQPVETLYSFADGKLTITTDQDGRKTTVEKPYPAGEWLPSAAASRYVEEQIKKGAKEITYRTVDPTMGIEVATMKHKVFDKVPITVKGKLVEALKTTAEASVAPGIVTTSYLDDEGEAIRTETSFGGMSMVTVVAGPEVVNAPSGEAPEMMLATFIKPDKPIKDARHSKKAVYILSVEEGELQDIPSLGSQKFERIDAKTGRLTVDVSAPVDAPKADVENKEFSTASGAIDSDDENIRRLARRATQKAGDTPGEKAEAMRRFVQRYITGKGLDVGFATATEVCKNRAGDCTEHGVLLAAMLRAAGIPSRVLAGLIYADEFAGSKGIFGYHMWAQALIDDGTGPKWVDLDGTLGPETPADATHIALGASALADDAGPSAMIAIASHLGRLKIKVESVQ